MVIVTGANSGIGFAATELLAARGATVVMACRDPERGRAARQSILERVPDADLHGLTVDMSSLASVDEFADQVRGRWSEVAALINNAAIFDISQEAPVDSSDGFERVWATNYLGPWRLTDRLASLLAASAPGRVVNICSKGLLAHPFLRIDLDDLDGRDRFSAERAYYRSKLALLSHTLELARTLGRDEIVAHAVWVPAVKVDLARVPTLPAWQRPIYALKRHFALEPGQLAPIYADLALSPAWGSRTGCLVDHTGKEIRPIRNVRDRTRREELEAATREAVEARVAGRTRGDAIDD